MVLVRTLWTGRDARAVLLELKRQHELAQQAIRARDDMLAMVSHDLKGPLQTLGLHIDALLEGSPARERRVVGRARLEAARRAVHRMKRLVGDLLDASRLDAGHFRLRPGEHDVGSLVTESLEPFQPTIRDKSIKLEVALDDLCRCAVVDKDRMIQVFSNLLDNAIRCTPVEGLISIRTTCLGTNRVRVSFENSGPGIPRERLGHVFDRYWQTDDERAGTAGLGLYIAKCIVEAHGGSIEVASEPGKGATFHLTLVADAAPRERSPSGIGGEECVT
jgi:signal transduction histidine kinase